VSILIDKNSTFISRRSQCYCYDHLCAF